MEWLQLAFASCGHGVIFLWRVIGYGSIGNDWQGLNSATRIYALVRLRFAHLLK